MNSNGGFHMVERDGKLFLVYNHPKYQPLQKKQSYIPSGETANKDNSLQPLFLCPDARCMKHYYWAKNSNNFPINSSPEYEQDGHHVLPLFWCNNKEFDVDGGCGICSGSKFGTDYYFCDNCDEIYHKECVESPFKIKHPYHPKHSLTLYIHAFKTPNIECVCCGRIAKYLVYCCTICQIFMHPICAMKSIPFKVDPPKKHVHPLKFFTRQKSLTCNVCGLKNKLYPTYVCLKCNFVAHQDCMYSPHIIKISRHPHRITYISSLQSRESSCGVCRQSIDHNYGAYICEKCCDYVVHLKCALGKDICDGVELEGVPEEDGNITQDVEPFNVISEGVILHFLHGHCLWLDVSIHYDATMFCQACVLPIFEGYYYSCKRCNFILHETCAKARCIIQHALHPHPLELKDPRYGFGMFICKACDRYCGGFVYQCRICWFHLDVQCASIFEPFAYKGHEDPLFLALNPEVKHVCHICKEICHKQLNCINCDFIVCVKCATLPDKAKYKHDEHFLRIMCEEEVSEKNWCEVCEHELRDMSKRMFYWCDECCSTFHIECLLGEDVYIKPGQFLDIREKRFHVLKNNNISRPYCDFCKNRCKEKIFKSDENIIACSAKCLRIE